MRTLDVFDRLPSAPILKYYLYVTASATWFVMPIWTLFKLEQGLSFTQVSVLNAVWFSSMVFGEIPTGYVGDRIGRRNSLVLGSVVSTGSMLLYGQLSTFSAFLVVTVLWGVGATFQSGAESAWLYDTLEAAADGSADVDSDGSADVGPDGSLDGDSEEVTDSSADDEPDETEFTRIKGRGNALRLAAMAGSALLGGYLAGIALYLPFVATAALTAVAGAIALTIPKNRAYTEACQAPADEQPDHCPDPDEFGPREAVSVIRGTLTAPPVRSFVIAVGLFYALAWATAMFTQPLIEDLALGAGLAEGQVVPLLGWLYAGFSALSAVVSDNADWIEEVVGPERWVVVAPAALGAVFLATLVLPMLAIPAFFLMRALMHATDVIKDRYLNEHSESVGRATVLSAAAMVFGLAKVPFRVLAGVIGDLTSPIGAIGTMGALLVVGSAGVLLTTGISWDSRTGTIGRETPDEAVTGD